jgi:hypothetical protein
MRQRKKLANTLRDGDHMAVFVQHADKIDFLQVDGAQMRQIARRTPPHRLAELGLDERCFTARSLQEAVDEVMRKAGAGGADQ